MCQLGQQNAQCREHGETNAPEGGKGSRGGGGGRGREEGGLGARHKRARGRSQEVVGGACLRRWLLLLGRGVKLQERVLQVLVNLHDRGLVPTAVAVVGR